MGRREDILHKQQRQKTLDNELKHELWMERVAIKAGITWEKFRNSSITYRTAILDEFGKGVQKYG